jgi:phycobilisome rod-core linker protein
MSIPLLDYAPTSQNQRVQGFEVAGDEQPIFALLMKSMR